MDLTLVEWMRTMKKTFATPAWDAELNTDACDSHTNADLTIRIKIAFRQINPPNGAAVGTYNDYGAAKAGSYSRPHKIAKWSPHEWAAWKMNFANSATSYWNGKFWLLNNFSEYEYTCKGIKYIPNLWCRFCLIAGDVGGGSHHHQIDVVRLDKSESWFGSHSRLYDNLDQG